MNTPLNTGARDVDSNRDWTWNVVRTNAEKDAKRFAEHPANLMSRGLIRFAQERLSARSMPRTQESVAQELQVSQGRISQILAKSSNEAFSRDVFARYAQQLGWMPAQLFSHLYNEDYVKPNAPDDDSELPSSRLNATESYGHDCGKALRFFSRLYQDKGARASEDVHLCYRFALLASDRVVRRIRSLGLISTALCFQSGDSVDFLSRTGHKLSADRQRLGHRRLNYVSNGTPRDVKAMIREYWDSPPSSQLVYRSPAIMIDPDDEPTRDFWQDLTGLTKRVGARKYRFHLVNIFRHDQTAAADAIPFRMALAFLLPADVVLDTAQETVMWQASIFVLQVRMAEMQRQINSVTRLLDMRVLPRDIASHSEFYDLHKGEANKPRRMQGRQRPLRTLEHLHDIAERFYAELREDVPEFARWVFAVELWTFDWDKSAFVSLSPRLNYYNERLAKATSTCTADDESVHDVYLKTLAKIHPRLNGKTGLVFRSRQLLLIGSRGGMSSCPERPALDVGTYIGMPVEIHDKANGRQLHGVMHFRCSTYIKKPLKLVKGICAVSRRCTIADSLAIPPLTGFYTPTSTPPKVRQNKRDPLVVTQCHAMSLAN